MMEPVSNAYPMRALVRHKAKSRLMADTDIWENCVVLDEELLRDLATTLFQNKQAQALYSQPHSRQEADEIENQLAIEVAEAYQRIKQQQSHPLVQWLNGLLS